VLRISNTFTLFFVALTGVVSSACQSGGVGDPCVPEDEYSKEFPGYQPTESNVESQSFQCETRVCLVANFRGRVSCPYGQDPAKPGASADQTCYLPGTKTGDPANAVDPTVKVDGWIVQPQDRRPEKAVYCSCRCDGPDKAARYCQCPSGFICQKLIEDINKGHAQLAGSYCIKEGTQVTDPVPLKTGQPCVPPNCGPAHPDEL
jgi:hypothetical protein